MFVFYVCDCHMYLQTLRMNVSSVPQHYVHNVVTSNCSSRKGVYCTWINGEDPEYHCCKLIKATCKCTCMHLDAHVHIQVQVQVLYSPQQVVSSVVDQDSYTGFVGVQEARQKSPSPSPSKSSSRVPKPDAPPPVPTTSMKIRPRVSSLDNGHVSLLNKRSSGMRPPKPDMAPPPYHPDGNVPKNNGAPLRPKPPTKSELNAHPSQSRSPSPKVRSLSYWGHRDQRISYVFNNHAKYALMRMRSMAHK